MESNRQQNKSSSLERQQASKQDGKPDLWAKILSDVAKRDDKEDSTVLLLGDKGAGKRSLIKAIN